MLGQVEQADVEGAHKQACFPFFLSFNYFIIHYQTLAFFSLCVPYHLCFAGQGVLLD
jgi:hypothetical protein